MSHPKRAAENGPKETARLEAFSDGVFAFAITLLVLELITMLHEQAGENLIKFCLHHWEPFLAFFIGFLTILVCWINHHHVFEYIKKTDTNLFWLNGFVLLIITFTPFPTAILAEYLRTEGRTAMAVYGFNYFMISIASYFLCAYPYRKQLVYEDDREFFNCVKQTYAYSIIYTLFAFLICFISIPVAIVLYAILFYVFAFPKEFATKLLNRRHRRNRKSAK